MIAEPNCSKRNCVHLLGVVGEEEPDQVCHCRAFPDGIPNEIAYGNELHLTPYPGDNGIQYEEAQS